MPRPLRSPSERPGGPLAQPAYEAARQSVPLREALTTATQLLSNSGINSGRVDAETLAGHVLGIDRGQLLAAAYAERPLPEKFWSLIEQRAERVPLQHLTGRVWFRRLPLAVGPGVFIPRPETEDVAGAAIAAAAAVARSGVQPLVVDLCTGSGAVALAVADEVASVSVVAIEVDPLAHGWAEHNVDRLEAGACVQLELGDAVSARADLVGRVDVVVTNPPYIPADMVPVDPEVADHDPHIALYGGEDGLDIARLIMARAAQLLRPGGSLVIEHADTQQGHVLRELDSDVWRQAEGHMDLTGRPRYVVAVRSDSPTAT